MKSSIAVLSLVALVLFVARTEGAGDGKPSDLSVAIVAVKDKAGTPTINREGTFRVVFTNQSDKPIRLWSGECQQGYETLSFQVEGGDGAPSRMYKSTAGLSAWKNKPPKTITIPPGQTLAWEVAPAEFFWGERMWKGAPEPNTGKPVTLAAVFEIKATGAAKEQGVWTGRVTSKPISALVIDAKLRTPHEYLWEACPKQALRIIQADRTWITKKDDLERTPLHLAARFGYVDVARWLLANGADVNARAYNNFMALHLTGDPEIVKLLIEHKADVNATSNGGTALQGAAGKYADLEGDPESAADREKARTIVKMLLAAGAEYDIQSAACLDDVEKVRVLVADKKQARDKEALRSATTYGRVKIVKLLLENGANPESTYYGGLTISYYAIERAEVLKLLFEAGADPKVRVEYRGNGKGPRQGSTLLHEAARRGIIESAKLLLARGVGVNLTDSLGATPLHQAIGQAPMVELLLQNGADAKARTKAGWTPMSLAASQVWPEQKEDNARYQAVIRALERAGVELDVFAAIACNDVQRVVKILQKDPKIGEARNPAGRTALQFAVTLDRKEIVKLLLDKGCNPDIPSGENGVGNKGETALLQAAFWGRLEIAEMLIERGANVNAKAAGGVVPLHEAARLGHVELARLLLNHGAAVNAKDDQGKTPLDWSGSYKESPEMTKLLRDRGGMR